MIRLTPLLFLLMPIATLATNLKPFVSDGCSWFPDGTYQHNKLWLNCCQAHDYDYWQGGTYQQRLDSDERLKACLTDVGQHGIGTLMFAGVRVGGTPMLPTSYRWGFGWPFPRPYRALTGPELQQVKDMTAGLGKQ